MARFGENAVITGAAAIIWDGITRPETTKNGVALPKPIYSIKVAFNPGPPPRRTGHRQHAGCRTGSAVPGPARTGFSGARGPGDTAACSGCQLRGNVRCGLDR